MLYIMKTGLVFVVALSLVSGKVLGQQQQALPSSGTNAANLGYEKRLSPQAGENRQLTVPGTKAGKHLRIDGPLVRPFREKRIRDVRRRALQYVNPLAPTEAAAPQLERVRDLNPRAWTTIVGWNTGRSAFPDAVTHESTMGLVTASRR